MDVYKSHQVSTRHVFKVRSGLKLPPISCTVWERACAGSYMCSLANVCHFVAGRSLFHVTMCAVINNPARCEVHAVIRFLLARINNAAEIHRQMRRGFPTQTSSQSDSQCNGATQCPRKQRSSNKHLQSEKSWPPFSGTERGSCLLIF